MPLLQKSTASPRVVNISSFMVPATCRFDLSSPTSTFKTQIPYYRAGKAALSTMTACQWAEYGAAGIKVFAYDLGFTVLDPEGKYKVEKGAKSAEEAVVPLMDILEGRRDDEAWKMLHDMVVYPW